jgi:hypothetical protein
MLTDVERLRADRQAETVWSSCPRGSASVTPSVLAQGEGFDRLSALVICCVVRGSTSRRYDALSEM